MDVAVEIFQLRAYMYMYEPLIKLISVTSQIIVDVSTFHIIIQPTFQRMAFFHFRFISKLAHSRMIVTIVVNIARLVLQFYKTNALGDGKSVKDITLV